MNSRHLFKLSKLSPQEKTVGGSRTKVSKDNFPILDGMSLYKLILNPNGIREPHWHANADELGYCLKGEVLVGLYDTGDVKTSFLVKPGEMFFIPSGALHAIENTGKENAEIILQFSDENVEDFNLSNSFGIFSDAVLGNTFGVPSKAFNSLKRSSTSSFATLKAFATKVYPSERYQAPYRYHLEASEPFLSNKGGSVRTARQNVWPILRQQAMYSLVLTGDGMREPHWHPETAELGYVAKGKGRMSVLNPLGEVDTYQMEEGDVYFIPKAYPHHIENLQTSDLHLLIFFDQATPKDIGFTGSIRSYSDETLASVMHESPGFFKDLSKYYQDQFIVKKINPVDC